MEQRKIIGYKAPSTLYGTIPKSTVYIKIDEDRYKPVDLHWEDILPSEIVETWEPAYEEEKMEIKSGESWEMIFDLCFDSQGVYSKDEIINWFKSNYDIPTRKIEN